MKNQVIEETKDNDEEQDNNPALNAIVAKIKKDFDAAGIDDENIEDEPTMENTAAAIHAQSQVKKIMSRREKI